AQRRDITPRADLLAFNNDRGDNTVEHRIAQLRTVASVRLAIKLRPALALCLAPSLLAGILGIITRHIDLDPAGQKVTAAVDRGDAAVAACNLTLNDTRGQNRKEKAEKDEPAP